MVPRLKELIDIAQFIDINKEACDFGEAEIVYKLPEEAFRKFNEEIYYDSHQGGSPDYSATELNIIIHGTHFKYIKEEKNQEA